MNQDPLNPSSVTRIQFKPEEKDQPNRGCYITGSLEGVFRAQQDVLRICRKKMTGEETVQNLGPPGGMNRPNMGQSLGQQNL